MEVFSFRQGKLPLIISMPHSGTALPEDLVARLTDEGATLADTDWHIPQLYNFLDELDVTVIRANYSRYVVDLNRFPDGATLYPGQSETGTCPTTSFTNMPLYRPGQELQVAEVQPRVDSYWQPYHQKLLEEISRVKAAVGFALLWDAHSIRSQVPRFFSGRLPDLNLGTADGNSCGAKLAGVLCEILQSSEAFSSVHNGRFKGGAITRCYGDPTSGVHAVQMEIVQACYMNESPPYAFDDEKADRLRPLLKELILGLLEQHPA